jgi:hypothetical protein
MLRKIKTAHRFYSTGAYSQDYLKELTGLTTNGFRFYPTLVSKDIFKEIHEWWVPMLGKVTPQEKIYEKYEDGNNDFSFSQFGKEQTIVVFDEPFKFPKFFTELIEADLEEAVAECREPGHVHPIQDISKWRIVLNIYDPTRVPPTEFSPIQDFYTFPANYGSFQAVTNFGSPRVLQIIPKEEISKKERTGNEVLLTAGTGLVIAGKIRSEYKMRIRPTQGHSFMFDGNEYTKGISYNVMFFAH